jgi:hypothetical protein
LPLVRMLPTDLRFLVGVAIELFCHAGLHCQRCK